MVSPLKQFKIRNVQQKCWRFQELDMCVFVCVCVCVGGGGLQVSDG